MGLLSASSQTIRRFGSALSKKREELLETRGRFILFTTEELEYHEPIEDSIVSLAITAFFDHILLAAAVNHLADNVYGRSFVDAVFIAAELEVAPQRVCQVLGVRPPISWSSSIRWGLTEYG